MIESKSDGMPVFLTVEHRKVFPAYKASQNDRLKDMFSWEWSSDSQRAIKFVDKNSAQMVLSMIKDECECFVSMHLFC